MIRAVLFDVGNTLVSSLDTSEIYQKIFKEKKIKKTLTQIGKAHAKGEADLKKRIKRPELLTMGVEEFYTEWNKDVLKHLKVKEGSMASYIHTRWFDAAELAAYEDSTPVLNKLAAMGLRIGLVTNGFVEEVMEVFHRTGLKTDVFSVIVGRDTAMAEKPDPRPFLHAAGSLGLKPDEIIFVGDSFKNDYEGSQGAGMMPVLILRGRKLPPEAPDDITTIETLDGIMDFIE